jgi:hypothetical protein
VKFFILLLLKEEELRMDVQRKPRRVHREKTTSAMQPSTKVSRGARQIVIPMTQQEYDAVWQAAHEVRSILEKLLVQHPELFPPAMQQGFSLEGCGRISRKLPGVRLRKIVLKDGTIYWLRPSFALPYMVGTVEELEGPLLLATYGVPFWLLTKVFGHNDMYWYRLVERLGRNSLVGTTVRQPERLPQHLAADEHHADWSGQKGYLATTAAEGCLLGIGLTSGSDEEHLTAAYEDFAAEARDLDPDYAPLTVNTDGWFATQNTFQKLFSTIQVVLCFLHGFLKIRDRCRKDFDLHTRVWDVYRAATAEEFLRRMEDLKTWSQTQGLPALVQQMLGKLFKRASEYSVAYAHPGCRRTSNMVDRLMNRMNRLLYAGRGLHGNRAASERRLRGWALLLNYRDFAPRSGLKRQYRSPAHRLNQFAYHQHWLHNLMTATSLLGFRKIAPAIR